MIIELKVPVLKKKPHEALVAKWYKAEGAGVSKGETVVALEGNSVVNDIPSPADGKIVKILSQEGAVVGVGAVLCTIEVR